MKQITSKWLQTRASKIDIGVDIKMIIGDFDQKIARALSGAEDSEWYLKTLRKISRWNWLTLNQSF